MDTDITTFKQLYEFNDWKKACFYLPNVNKTLYCSIHKKRKYD